MPNTEKDKIEKRFEKIKSILGTLFILGIFSLVIPIWLKGWMILRVLLTELFIIAIIAVFYYSTKEAYEEYTDKKLRGSK